MIKKKPFVKYNLEEDSNWRGFTVRINDQERQWLDEIKEDFNIKSDSKALKTAAFIGKNVSQALFGRKMLRYLFKKERQKLEDFKNIKSNL